MDTATAEPVVILTQEQRSDLRRFVLSGGKLTVEQARAVIDSCRTGQSLIGMGEPKAKRAKSSKPAMADEALDADLKDLGI